MTTGYQTESSFKSANSSESENEGVVAHSCNATTFRAVCNWTQLKELNHDLPKVKIELKPEDGPSFVYKPIADTGTSLSIVSEKFAKSKELWLTKPKMKIRLFDATGNKMRILGITKLFACKPGTTKMVEIMAVVSPDIDQHGMLLSWMDLENLGFVNLAGKAKKQRKWKLKN